MNITYTRSGQTTRLQADDSKLDAIDRACFDYIHPDGGDPDEPARWQTAKAMALKLNERGTRK